MSAEPNLPRIEPLEPPYPAEDAAFLSKWMPPNSGLDPLVLFRTLARHPELGARMRPLGAGILAHGLLDPPLRELMILRTCALAGCEYEWGVHVVTFARPLGLSEEQIRSTATGSFAGCDWAPEQTAVLGLAEVLHETAACPDLLWEELGLYFDAAEKIELIVTAGWYRMVALLCNGLRIEREPWAESFPT